MNNIVVDFDRLIDNICENCQQKSNDYNSFNCQRTEEEKQECIDKYISNSGAVRISSEQFDMVVAQSKEIDNLQVCPNCGGFMKTQMSGIKCIQCGWFCCL